MSPKNSSLAYADLKEEGSLSLMDTDFSPELSLIITKRQPVHPDPIALAVSIKGSIRVSF